MISTIWPTPNDDISSRSSRSSTLKIVSAEAIFIATYRNPDDQVPAVAISLENIEELFSDWSIVPDAPARFAQLRTAALVGDTLMSRFRKAGKQIILRLPIGHPAHHRG